MSEKNTGKSSGESQNNQRGIQPLNIERLPPLLAKWQKALGTDLESIEIKYTSDGVDVSLTGRHGTPFDGGAADQDSVESISPGEYARIKKEQSAPKPAESLTAFRNKYELRLNKEFPAIAPASGSEADITAWLATQPFKDRRALLLSKKAFEKAYPNGFA
jgi:hypothetical protein